MSAAPAFCRLVLGDAAAADAAADAAAPAADRGDEIAGAWRACQPVLERRRDTLAWGTVAPGESPVVAGLAALLDLQRGVVAAQALGLEPHEIETALATGAGTAPGLLARAHARLAGLDQPADAACAAERERLAGVAAGDPGRTQHCADCRAFGGAVTEQRAALRRLAGPVPRRTWSPEGRPAPGEAAAGEEPAEEAEARRGEEPRGLETEPVAEPAPSRRVAAASRGTDAGAAREVGGQSRAGEAGTGRQPAQHGVGREPAPAGSARFAGARLSPGAKSRGGAVASRVRGALADRGAPPPALVRVLEPEGRRSRAAVGLAVVLLGGLVGYGAVSAVETPQGDDGGSGVVTATPVGPLPPGVGPTDP